MTDDARYVSLRLAKDDKATIKRTGANMDKQYVAPSIKVLGSLSELTLREKSLGTPNDGDFLRGPHGKESLTEAS